MSPRSRRIVLVLLAFEAGCIGNPTDETGQIEASSKSKRLCGQDKCDAVPLASGRNFPNAISLKGDTLYWDDYADGVNSVISSIPKGGGPVTPLMAGQEYVCGLAAGSQHLYFTSFGLDFWDFMNDGFVARIARDGGAVRYLSGHLAEDGPEQDPSSPAIGGNYVYWSDAAQDRIRRMSLSTLDVTTFASGEHQAWSTAADSDGVAWISYLDNAIRSAPHSGGTPQTIATDPDSDGSAPFALAMNERDICWVSNNWPAYPGYLRCVSRAAPHVTRLLMRHDTGSAVALAMDSTHVYWVAWTASGTDGEILRTPVSGGPTVRLARGQNIPYGIVLDEDHLYWFNQGSDLGEGAIMRMEKYDD